MGWKDFSVSWIEHTRCMGTREYWYRSVEPWFWEGSPIPSKTCLRAVVLRKALDKLDRMEELE